MSATTNALDGARDGLRERDQPSTVTGSVVS